MGKQLGGFPCSTQSFHKIPSYPHLYQFHPIRRPLPYAGVFVSIAGPFRFGHASNTQPRTQKSPGPNYSWLSLIEAPFRVKCTALPHERCSAIHVIFVQAVLTWFALGLQMPSFRLGTWHRNLVADTSCMPWPSSLIRVGQPFKVDTHGERKTSNLELLISSNLGHAWVKGLVHVPPSNVQAGVIDL